MRHSRVDLKNPWLAGCLAYLIPGAGHLYQGRYFKGILYSTCILGTFLYGMHLGDWCVVYTRTEGGESGAGRSFGYFAQVLVGLPALPAAVQSYRHRSSSGEATGYHNAYQTSLDAPIEAPFVGQMMSDNVEGEITGRILLEPVTDGPYGREVRGTFSGLLKTREPVALTLGEPVRIGPDIYSSSRRRLQCRIVADTNGADGEIQGTIPRPFWNWFQVPMHDDELQVLHGRLGRYYELAQVFTWIAGLLNLFAVWDALEGPAYGYGDEDEEEDEDEESENKQSSEEQAEKQTAAGRV